MNFPPLFILNSNQSEHNIQKREHLSERVTLLSKKGNELDVESPKKKSPRRKVWVFSVCAPRTLCAPPPPLQSTCQYLVNLYVKILYVPLEDASKLRTLIWGAQTHKIHNLYTKKVSTKLNQDQNR